MSQSAAPPHQPTVSVVLCVLNAATTVGEQLEALSRQDLGTSWELLVVDNGCTDATLSVVERWQSAIPSLRVIDATDRRGLAHARNVGVEAANGAIVAFCDADDVVTPPWLAALLLQCEAADLVGGRLDVEPLNSDNSRYWKGAHYSNGGSPTDDGLPRIHGYLPFALGANFAVRRETYLAVGGCDEQFVGSSDDVDLSWRVQRSGATLAFAPDAVVQYRLRPDIRTTARQQWNYGRTEARLRKKFPVDAQRDSMKGVLRVYWFLLSRVHHLIRGSALRGHWLCILSYRAGRVRGAIEQRVLWW